MLKFPIGWANTTAEVAKSANKPTKIRYRRRVRSVACIAGPQHLSFGVCDLVQRRARLIRVEDVKVRIQIQGAGQKPFALGRSPNTVSDYPGMEQQERISCAQTKRLVHVLGCFGRLAVLIKDPRQRIPAVN